MNSNVLKSILGVAGVLILGLFLAQWIVQLETYHQFFVIGVFVVVGLLFIIKPKVGIDVKLLAFVCLGYAFGGKGFAYISPFAPFFISEICLFLCLVSFLFRFQEGLQLFSSKNKILIALFIFILYSGLHLFLLDLRKFGIIAIQDSALAYYGLFVFTTIVALKKEVHFEIFKKVILWMGPLAMIGWIANITGAASAIPFSGIFFNPHVDIAIPLMAASGATAFIKGVSDKKLLYIGYSILAVGLLFTTKTSALFCLLAIMGSLVVFIGRREFIAVSIVGGVTIVALVAGLYIFKGKVDIGGEHLETAGDMMELELNQADANTTAWRLTWWTTIAEETWQTNPILGAGFGGDITGSFSEKLHGFRVPPQYYGQAGLARYPHNVFFTVLGRLGYPAVLFFTLIQIAIFIKVCNWGRRYIARGKPDYALFMGIVFVIAGLANSFVQMTYEGPYAAIPHWVTLGFVYAFVAKIERERAQVRREENALPEVI